AQVRALPTDPRELATARDRVTGTTVVSQQASVVGQPSSGGGQHWARPSGDQSNTLAFADNRLVLKLFRRIEPGLNPEYELGRFFNEHHFTRAPALVGALEYHRAGLEPGTLAIVETAITHHGPGWEFTVTAHR